MHIRPRILLINGNSSPSITDRLAILARAAAPQLEFHPLTPQGGPAYVSTPADVALAAQKVIETIAFTSRNCEPDGCIIACFGEPGLLEARRRFEFPIVGMAEASMLTAMQLGDDFAIVTLGEHWPAMLGELVKLYGVQDRCVRIERIEGTPLELMANPQQVKRSVTAAAENCGANIMILGGAALSGLASTIGPLPAILLVDCLQASIAQMIALIAFRQMTTIADK